MNHNDYQLVRTGRRGKIERYNIFPSAIADFAIENDIAKEYGQDSNVEFYGEDEVFDTITTLQVNCNGIIYNYVPWGQTDDMPIKLRKLISENMVEQQCLAFDISCCYGQGLRFVNRDEKHGDSTDPDIRQFCLENNLHEVFMEQATDMKYYFWTAMEIILSRDGSKIVSFKNLDVMFCRLEKRKDGKINHLFYGDFGKYTAPTNAVAIPLLDPNNPLADLEVRMGKRPNSETGRITNRIETCRKYAIITRMPTPGCRYYPTPYYLSVFKDNWHDIYKLIGIGKKFMIKNTSAPRMQIEVNVEYWSNICQYEGITDPEKQKERVDREKQNLIRFVCGVENAGKASITNSYTDPNGKETSMVKFIPIAQSKKEGGDWSEDMSEASNSLCFAFGVHPNLIGATPGKSQMNNSGSDKRELFSLKQATEKPCHDIMAKPYHVILYYNRWQERCTVDVPMIELTTLDQNTSQKKASINNNKQNDDDDDNGNN